ncbi:MAG: amidase [Stenotrophobium sp.]
MRYLPLLPLLALLPAISVCACPPSLIGEADVPTLQAEMAQGCLSAHVLTAHYLERIEAIDRRGPQLDAVIEVNPDALAIADRLDRERAEGRLRGPLHGIPVLLKDNIDTADRLHTSAGSLALAQSIAPADAFLVKRLRDAGAVILGKANLSEWANFRSAHSSSGWSGRGGQTRNPYAPERSPCGSSSGSAVAVSANLSALAVGSETDGSIVCPASVNGIVGLKPTVGLISRNGIIPISFSQDTAGPMARTVTDAAILLNVLAGSDTGDPATQAAAGHIPGDYRRYLQAAGLKGARIGVARKLAGFSPPTDVVFDQAIATLKAAGATIVDPADIATQGQFDDDELTVLLYEFKYGINRYLRGLGSGSPVKSLGDLIAFNQREAGREMAWFGQDLFLQAQAKGGLDSAEYLLARQKSLRLAGHDGIDATLAKYRIDAIVAPTAGPAWTIDLVNGDHISGGGASSAAAVAGYPHITVPAGFVHGLPVGLSFIGTAWSEPLLLRLAYAYEQASKARRPPDLATASRAPPAALSSP